MKPGDQVVERTVELRPEFHRKDVAKCSVCGHGLAHTGLPFFYRVTVERFGMDAGAIRRMAAMEDYFGGNVALANVFSTGEPLAKRFDLIRDLLVCEGCSVPGPPLAQLLEIRAEREEQEAADAPAPDTPELTEAEPS